MKHRVFGSWRTCFSIWILGASALLLVPALVTQAQARDLPDFTEVVERTSAAVVNISTTQKIAHKRPTLPHGAPPDFPGTPFDDFFRRFFGEEGEGMEEYNAKSLGSGFVISSDGFVLTNNHVIKDADEIIVRLSDRRELVAEIVGTDARSDVALLKIDADDLPVVKVGEVNKLKVGEWVLAIGSPFDFDHTVTAGIVSALGRSLPSENYVPFIQTDVAINPGNSGGPLFNLEGEVIGINAQIYSRTGGFMGLSFAIPIDLAMNVVDQLKTKGHVSRGWLGVLIQDVTRELAESFDMERPEGALVARVLPDSPAEEAGLEVGDIIVEFNGRVVVDSRTLPPMVGRTAIGKPVPIKVMRDGKQRNLKVTIGELPDEEEIALSSNGSRDIADKRLNVVVVDLNDEQRQKLEIEEGGVVVQEVKSGPARKAGIRRGDVILKINNEDVEDAKHFKDLVSELPEDKSIPILVQRGKGRLFLPLKIAE